MTDREVMVAVLKAVGELAVRLTGKPIRVLIPTQSGTVAIETPRVTIDDEALEVEGAEGRV